MERIIKNIIESDIYTQSTIALLAIIGTGAALAAFVVPASLITSAICFGLAALAYNTRND